MSQITDTEINAYFAKLGLTREQAEANLRKRGYSEEYVQKEIEVGPMLDKLIGFYKRYAKENPNWIYQK